MFIKYENISSDDRIIDVRTRTEYKETRLFPINMPIINEQQYEKIKKFYPSAFFLIVKSMITNRKKIKNRLLKESNYGTFSLIFVCSRGRLRSPLVCIYAKILGLNAKVLLGGVKGQLQSNKYRGGKYHGRYKRKHR